jgi:hypothetical protein
MGIQLLYITPPWPQGPIRIPGLRSGPVEFSEHLLFFEVAPQREVTLPQRAYLRELADLDLSSAEAIARFVESHGHPGGEGSAIGPLWRDLQDLLRPLGEEHVPADLPALPASWVKQHRPHPGKMAYPLAEFVERAALVCDMTRLQLFRQGQLALDEVADSWQSRCLAPPASPEHALLMPVMVINWALSPLQPHLGIAASDGEDDPWPRFEHALIRRRPMLFEALNLQLFNDIGSQIGYRRCANERCHKWFAKSAPGKLFCDNDCARLEMQRRYRRRTSKRWREAARSFALEARVASPQLSWAQLFDQFARRYADQPYNGEAQYRRACNSPSDASRRAG